MTKLFSKLLLLFLIINHLGLFAQDSFYNETKIREIRIYFKESNWDHILDSLFINFQDDGRLEGNVSIDGKLFKNAGIRFKGYSSWNIDERKNPFNIDLDYIHKNQNYEGFTKLKLSNVIHDPSFVREVLSYEIARNYLPSSQANFANVYVNDSLIGLYSNVEAVDKKFVSKHFGSDINCFFKGSPLKLEYPFGDNANLAYDHGTDSATYMKYYKLESDWGWTVLMNLIYTLNKDTSEIESVLNVDRTLWMHAFNYTVLNLDSYIGYSQNYYMYRDDNGRFNPILWDMNMSFGSFRESDGSTHFKGISIHDIKILNPLQHLAFSISPRPLISNIIANPVNKRMYLAHIRTIVKENFKNNLYYKRGKELQKLIDTCVLADINKFNSYDDFKKNIDTITGSGSELYPGIKDLMEARMAYLDTFPGFSGEPVVLSVGHFPEYPQKNKTAYIRAKINNAGNAFLYIRFSGKDVFTKKQMFDDGLHGDSLANDKLYAVDFTTEGNVIQYYIYSENDSAGVFSPERAAYNFYSIQPLVPKGNLLINELMADNKNTIHDQYLQFDPWIELVNTADEDIRLHNCSIRGNSALQNYSFPDTFIKARKYLVIWADGENYQKGLHTDFKLNSDEGRLSLYNQQNEEIDSVDYSNQESGKTYGRYPNGHGDFVFMLPSFAAYNTTPTTPENGVKIFPNPAKESVYLEMKNETLAVQVQIISSEGQIVLETGRSESSGSLSAFNEEINLAGIRKGVYCMKIICGDKLLFRKFVIY